jgi:hypothetical protein
LWLGAILTSKPGFLEDDAGLAAPIAGRGVGALGTKDMGGLPSRGHEMTGTTPSGARSVFGRRRDKAATASPPRRLPGVRLEKEDRAQVCPVSWCGPVWDYGRVMPLTAALSRLASESYRTWMTYFGLCVNAPGSL